MNRMMITSTNTLSQLQLKLDTISSNIANVDTTGYKRKEANFTDLLVQQFNNQPDVSREIGRLTPNGIRQGTGAKLGQTQLSLTQGSLKTTNRSLDVALTKPDLFFSVRVSDQSGENIRYTRDGAFFMTPVNGNDQQVMLVTGAGNPVLDEFNRPIVVNGNVTDVSISENGQIKVETSNRGTQFFEMGIVSVKKPQFMEQLGGNLLALPANFNELNVNVEDILTSLTGGLRNEISVTQGALESSNVNLSKEMSNLIMVQRQYQFQSRAITMADQMQGLVNSIR
ncbi:flagellar basal-body rod protein FlgG [Peribacillus huizhouensis]|uniref:Flagellar basal-body rod protein FlgG n=2 Tax=Bacillales TaxID=1385 RepID=A0ABR6CS60_9BACI|nr:flagellar basal-body rod protein FlgG [Peribacillus huizhouensis]